MIKFRERVNLKDFSNYRIGGPADFFFEGKNTEELKGALLEAKKLGIEIFVLGGGTNLLVRDEGFRGLVLKPSINFIEQNHEILSVGAGVLVSDLLNFTIEKELSGLEWAGGLPGTVGGAIRGNAGAFGGEIKDSILEAESLDMDSGKVIFRSVAECDFGYRSSIFKTSGPSTSSGQAGEIILSAKFSLQKGKSEDVAKAIQEKIDYRKLRHPLEYPNTGSTFKNVSVAQINADVTQIDADTIRVHPRGNPRLSAFTTLVKKDPFPVVPAARLITLSGLKGKTYGGAMISEKHGNFIVNTGDAKASDVMYLIDLVKREVKNKFGIELEEEVQII